MAAEERKVRRVLVGEVVSDKMSKTVVVEIMRMVEHPKFHKRLKYTKKYQVHDESEMAEVGDVVEIYEGRPMSKMKHMHLARVIRKSSQISND